MKEELNDISKENSKQLDSLKFTPGGAFGSCRLKLKDPVKNKKEFQRILEVFNAHNIGYFFYNGGGDSQDTTLKLSQYCKSMNYELQCIGLPKTIDNDVYPISLTLGAITAAQQTALFFKNIVNEKIYVGSYLSLACLTILPAIILSFSLS